THRTHTAQPPHILLCTREPAHPPHTHTHTHTHTHPHTHTHTSCCVRERTLKVTEKGLFSSKTPPLFCYSLPMAKAKHNRSANVILKMILYLENIIININYENYFTSVKAIHQSW